MLAQLKRNAHWILIGLLASLIIYFLPLIISMKTPPGQLTLVTIISIMVLLFLSVTLTLLVPWRSLFKRNFRNEAQTLPIKADDIVRAQELDDLLQRLVQLELDKERFRLANKKLKLESDQLSIEWQKEALNLVSTSPWSAIIIAWLGLEQDIKRAAKRLLVSREQDREPLTSISELLSALESAGEIDHKTLMDIESMDTFRNKMIYGNGEQAEIDPGVALAFIRQALSFSNEIARKMAIEQN